MIDPIHVLLIEDNPGDARLIEEMLSEARTVQFQLTTAGSLAGGFEWLEKTKIDLILLDLSLPDGQGLNNFSKLRQHNPHLPIIVLSGFSNETLAFKAVQEGAQDYLVKGEIDSKWLVRSLYYAIERKRVERAEQEILRLKDEFIANVSHQLRTPLTSLRGFLKFLREGKAKDPALQQEFLGRASQDADRLMALINDLLDQFRLETAQFQLDLNEKVDLNTLIAETVQSCQGLAGQKEVQLSYSPPEASLMVKANRHWLQQVLVNLLTNAIKFSKAHQPVTITSETINNQVMIKVIDQGPGIPAEALPHLFSKFYQVDSKVKGNGRGTGLGLYISKQIIEAHGGQIGANTMIGQGSTFFFTLPRLTVSRLKRLKREEVWAR